MVNSVNFKKWDQKNYPVSFDDTLLSNCTDLHLHFHNFSGVTAKSHNGITGELFQNPSLGTRLLFRFFRVYVAAVSSGSLQISHPSFSASFNLCWSSFFLVQ